MGKIKLLIILFLGLQVSLYSQTVSVTQLGTIEVNCEDYTNDLYQIWNISIPTGKNLELDYSVNIENNYDQIKVYSINDAGTATLQETLTGLTSGKIYSLFNNGKMKIVFTTDRSVCCVSNSQLTGFRITISEEPEIPLTYQYDNAGNRTDRVITLSSLAALRSSEESTPIEDAVAKQEIKIYPNPTQGMLTVEIVNYTTDLQADFLLTDMSGKIIYRGKANSGNQTFNLSNQPSGIYLLRININGENTTWKIIKK